MDQIFSFIYSATAHLIPLDEGKTQFWLVLWLLLLTVFSAFYVVMLVIETFTRITLRLADRRRKTKTYWKMSSWQLKENGDWKQQPILWVNGAKYVFGTPQEYIAVLKSIARKSGDPKGNVKSVVVQLHQSARFRANARATRGWKPDPPLKSEPAKPIEPSPIFPLEDVLASMDEYPVQTDSGPRSDTNALSTIPLKYFASSSIG